MLQEEFIGFLGWVTAISFGLAISNYVVKWLNKNLVPILPENLKKFVPLYQRVMKLIIKYHKWFAFTAIAAVGTHFFIAVRSGLLSLTGLISASLMVLLVLVGAYGTYIKGRKKGLWLIIHRGIALIMVATITIHIL